MIQLRFHPAERYFLTSPKVPKPYDVMEPVYVTMSSHENYKLTKFTFNYKENLAIGCFHSCFPKSPCLGYHPGDVEYVIILEAGSDKLAYFSAHAGEGRWYRWEECEVEDGALIVYVALNSHANYPHAGTTWRLCGLANDVTSSRGYHMTSPTFLKTTYPELHRPLPPLPI